MKNVLIMSVTVFIAVVLVGGTPTAGFGQCPCVVNCPAGDNSSTPSPLGGTKTPDLVPDAVVDIVDLATFALHYTSPPRPYLFCADYNCDGRIDLVDFANFAMHYGHAGPNPGYNAPATNHYKTYETTGPFFPGPVWSRDQFGEVVIDELMLTKFATPVSKNNEGICDTLAHQSWWEFLVPQPIRIIEAQDQFGTHEWMLGDARFLLLPALKNDPTGQPIPELNHYICYDANGPMIEIPVRLGDQFDLVNVVVLDARYFCNPCEKQTPDGFVYPIIDPSAHLTVYFVDNPTPYQIEALVRDQFMEGPVLLRENFFLAVPALKTQVFEPGSTEWDRIKALFESRTRTRE
jgi:hypothetical protein